MNANEVLSALKEALASRRADIELMTQFAGGWEGWLQCEIALRFPLGSVQREIRLWNDRRACDLFFEDPTAPSGAPSAFCVELKCFGLNRAYRSGNDPKHISDIQSTYQAWSNDVLADAAKLRELPDEFDGMSIVLVPTWLPPELLTMMKQQLDAMTYRWEQHHGFYIGINLKEWL